jgi:hypothetical protein
MSISRIISNTSTVKKYTSNTLIKLVDNDLVCKDTSGKVIKCGDFLDPQTIHAGTIGTIKSCQISSNKWAIVYTIGDDAYCKIMTYSSGVQTYGTAVLIDYYGYYLKICKIGEDKFVVGYMHNNGATYILSTICATVSGTVPTFGTTNESMVMGSSVSLSIAKLNTDKFVVCWKSNSYGINGTYTCVYTISGTTITEGTKVLLQDLGASLYEYIDVCQLDTDKFAVTFKDSAGTGSLVIGTVSGTVPTHGTALVFYGATNFQDSSSVALSATELVIAIEYGGTAGTVYYFTVSARTPTAILSSDFVTANISFPKVMKINSSAFFIAYTDQDNLNYVKGIIYNIINGAFVKESAPRLLKAINTGSISGDCDQNNKILFVSFQSVATYYGMGIISDLSPIGICQGTEMFGTREIAVTLF